MDYSHLKMPKFKPNVSREHVRSVMKKTAFIDIETSLIRAYVYRLGKNHLTMYDLVEGDQTKILTAAWGTWYDMYHQGEAGVYYAGNHHDPEAFKNDPLDDTYVLSHLWHVLNDADIIVAHNASFDRGWIEGRFMELGWKQPSKYYVYCTRNSLYGLSNNSKKLDYLSRTLIDSRKVDHSGKELWIRCNNGDYDAFCEMEEYNIGDIYETLYKVYMRTALYANRLKCIDLGGDGLFCSVTGDALDKLDEPYIDRITGLKYHKYQNAKYGFTYRDRYNTKSKKADQGYIKPLIANGVK